MRIYSDDFGDFFRKATSQAYERQFRIYMHFRSRGFNSREAYLAMCFIRNRSNEMALLKFAQFAGRLFSGRV